MSAGFSAGRLARKQSAAACSAEAVASTNKSACRACCSDLIIPVNAFVADEVELQRDQFRRVNSAKPLPHDLITELLPEVGTSLPANLSARRIPSAICDWLNSEKTSPFFGLIRRASTSEEQKAKTVVSDTSVVKMIKESLTSPARSLFPYRNIATGETDFDGICKVLVLETVMLFRGTERNRRGAFITCMFCDFHSR